MSSISELIRQQKREASEKNLLSTLRFWVIVLPLLLLYCTTKQLHAKIEANRYEQECSQRNAPTVGPGQEDTPCIYTQEMASLNEVDDSKGRTEDEEIQLTDASGNLTSVLLGRNPTWDNMAIKDNRLTPSVVDGPCLVERWHGTVTTIYTRTLKLTSHDNPDLKYGGILFSLMAFSFVLFLICCALLWWKTSQKNSPRV